MADGFVIIKAKEAGGGGVDEGDLSVGGEDEDPFAEGFEDGFEEAFVAQESIHEGLHLLGVEAVEAGEEFVDEGGLHGVGVGSFAQLGGVGDGVFFEGEVLRGGGFGAEG